MLWYFESAIFSSWLVCRSPRSSDDSYSLAILQDARHKRIGRSSLSVGESQLAGNYRTKQHARQSGTTETSARQRGRKYVGLASQNTMDSPQILHEGESGPEKLKENKLCFGIQLVMSAEALHKARMALESIVEPWACVLKAKFVSSTPNFVLLSWSKGSRQSA